MSVFDLFFSATEALFKFNKGQRELIESNLVFRTVPKNHKFVEFEEVSQEVFFIVKGSARMYYLSDEGKEITGFVYFENMFCGSLESFFSNTPSVQIFQTIEECDLIVIGKKNLDRIYKAVPEFNILVRKILEQRMIHAQKVVASLIMLKPAERYQKYVELHPGIEQRIPQHILSTFMGITPVSLSRIRGRPQKREAQNKNDSIS